MIKAIIFDLDGVIVSTDNYHYKAWKQLADKEGIFFNEEINHQLRGISRMDSLDIILRKSTKAYTEEEKVELAAYKNDIYRASLSSLTKDDILPGVMDLLEDLKKHNFKVAIGSSSKNAKTILKNIGLETYFDAISDGTNITRSKPDPEVFLKAAEYLGMNPLECAVVEDAISGIEAAKRANMMAFAVGDAKKSTIKDHDFEEMKNVLL